MHQSLSEMVESLIAQYFAYWREKNRLRYVSESLTDSPLFVSNIAEPQKETKGLD